MPRFMLTIEGLNWTDLDEIELGRAPSAGEPINTKYGFCVVTKVEPAPGSEEFEAHIFCRFP